MMQSRKQLNVMLEPILSNTSTPKITDTPTTTSSLPQIANQPTKA